MGKPRMVRSDSWRKRPKVVRYWAYKDELVRQSLKIRFTLPEDSYHIVFHIPMPKSWSKKKKASMLATPHQDKPDKDNLEKGFLDALCEEDKTIWDGRVTKLWSNESKICVYIEDPRCKFCEI